MDSDGELDHLDPVTANEQRDRRTNQHLRIRIPAHTPRSAEFRMQDYISPMSQTEAITAYRLGLAALNLSKLDIFDRTSMSAEGRSGTQDGDDDSISEYLSQELDDNDGGEVSHIKTVTKKMDEASRKPLGGDFEPGEDLTQKLSSTAADDNNDDEDNYVMYKDRSEWSDVEPIAQQDGPPNAAVVRIQYSQKFEDVYNYFRGVMKKNEKSLRVMGLTSDAIMLNAANYTVWQYRRDVLEALEIPCLMTPEGLSAEFAREFDFSGMMICDNQKNYQVWHHRKMLVSWASGFDEESGKIALECPVSRKMVVDKELALTKLVIGRDWKNYHAWQHRQWVICSFGAFEQELEYVDTLIDLDVRNNSAWNQRYLVVSNLPSSKEKLEDELEYTWSQIKFAWSNESPWNYMRGILRLYTKICSTEQSVQLYASELVRCQKYMTAEAKSNPMYSFTLDVIDYLMSNGVGSTELLSQALKICDILKVRDEIRKNFWEHTKRKFLDTYSDRFGSNASEPDVK